MQSGVFYGLSFPYFSNTLTDPSLDISTNAVYPVYA